MAFQATNQLPADALEKAKRIAAQSKQLAENRSASWATGGNAQEVLAAIDNLKVQRDLLNDLKAVPGLATYAQEQENSPTYDVVTEFNALIASMDAAISQMAGDLPTDGTWLLVEQIDLSGNVTPRTFTGGQLSAARASLDAVAAAVA